jgi:sugar fermentation stimulation protein A
MKFRTTAHQGIFQKRYKRFFADVSLNGEIVVAHVANTGSLKTAVEAGRPCLLTEAENPERKLRYSLQAVQMPSGWVGVNTSWPNLLAKEAFAEKIFPHWKKYDQLQAEVKISKETRLDLLLTNSKSGKKHYVEIKNVSMASGDLAHKKGLAQFPDAVTERGQKHLKELMKIVEKGDSAEILFVLQRQDCQAFSPADEIDPEYGKLLRQAKKAGVMITIATIVISKTELKMKASDIELRLK